MIDCVTLSKKAARRILGDGQFAPKVNPTKLLSRAKTAAYPAAREAFFRS